MKEGTKNIIAACILALGMIFSVYIYVSTQRYEYKTIMGGSSYRTDKWTGKEIWIDTKTGNEIKE